MGGDGLALHYVCTWEEAREIASRHPDFWVSNCGCREARGGCSRSRMDVCLQFCGETAASGSEMRKIAWPEVEGILREARETHLVTRPFRHQTDRTVTEGICFCCDDCCGYFLDPQLNCDKGKRIEKTDLSACNNCAACTEVCHFNARSLEGGRLTIARERCYGCGLCVPTCSLECIEMVLRG